MWKQRQRMHIYVRMSSNESLICQQINGAISDSVSVARKMRQGHEQESNHGEIGDCFSSATKQELRVEMTDKQA